MSILDIFRKSPETKQPRFNFRSSYFPTSGIPPARSMEGFLSAYGEIGWLHAVVFRIALGCSEVKWQLFNTKDRKSQEIYEHPVLSLLNKVNPFMTSPEFIALDTIYQELVGESFWILNFNGLDEPAEIWIPYPHKMSVVPDRKNFIKGYVYGSGPDAVPFDLNEVIHFKYPNPLNQYRGFGPTQSISVDLDAERYSGEWNRNFFYNSARPDGIIQFDYNLSDEQFTRIKEEWSSRYKGVSKAHQVALLEGGGKYVQVNNTIKDMDFATLKLRNRDAVLGVFGMPLSVMGISENVNKANAEAGDYTFARWIVKPRLDWKVAKLQEQLIPKFKKSENLRIGYAEVVPETVDQKRELAESGMRAGYLTINEARHLRGLDPLPDGDVLLVPMNLVPTAVDSLQSVPGEPSPNNTPQQETIHARQEAKALQITDEQKETHWRTFIEHTELFEKSLIEKMRGMFNEQKGRALLRLNAGERRLLKPDELKAEYINAATPVLMGMLRASVSDGLQLVNPEPGHKQNPQTLAEKWLRTRIGWAAAQTSEETARLLAEALADGYALGEGIPQLAARVEDVFKFNDSVRAERIARTEIIMASNEGALYGYAESGVEKAEFYSGPQDGRICDDCLALNGEVFDLEEAHGMIPLHVNCRCCYLPVVE